MFIISIGYMLHPSNYFPWKSRISCGCFIWGL